MGLLKLCLFSVLILFSHPLFAGGPAKAFEDIPEDAPQYCGKCHGDVLENYLKSAHALAPNHQGPNCVTCHQSHDLQGAPFNLIQEDLCGSCHSFEKPRRIKEIFVLADLAFKNQEKKLEYLSQRGMPVKRLEKKLLAQKNSMYRMTHILNLDDIEAANRQVSQGMDEMNQETEDFMGILHRRWMGGVLVSLFLMVVIFFLIRLLKTYKDNL